MLIGAHAPNGPITSDDIQTMRIMGAQAVKLMAADHSPTDVAKFPGMTVIVRLPDSRHADGTYSYAPAYAMECAAYAKMFAKEGVTLFQWDNEPNIQWRQSEYGAWPYQEWCRQALRTFRANVPSSVKLISPPLSWSPAYWRSIPDNRAGTALDDWRAAFRWTDKGQRPMLWSLFDYAGANVYWQYKEQLADPSFGLSYEQVHDDSQLPVWVTEFACSANEPPLKLPGGQVEQLRMRLYPQWLQGCRTDGYVEGACVFIVGGTPEWQGYKLTPAVAACMAPQPKRSKRINGPTAA